MTLVDMVKKFDDVPYKFEYPTGEKFEVFTRRKTGNKGYIVSVWQMISGVQHEMIWYANGDTVEKAKENLKKKILKHG